ncbi:hypothetical protein BDZ97DRAFT_1998394, partial [Flammula alnicola]
FGSLAFLYTTDPGLKTVVEEISSCTIDSALLAVGQIYYDHYIRACTFPKPTGGRIPTPSNHASRPSFDKLADMIKANLVEAPQSHADATNNALIRNGYRCVVTGKYDAHSVKENRDLEEVVDLDPNARMSPTECAHIFVESTNSSIEPDSNKAFHYVASMWGVMARFGHEKLLTELNGSDIHRLENVMTVVPEFHTRFDELSVWFKEEDKYKLEGAWLHDLRDYPEYVTFTTTDPVQIPVPSPTYLAIHATCAKVAHLSGAAECIDKLYRDMDDGKTLDPNGASAGTLEHAIFELQASGYELTI